MGAPTGIHASAFAGAFTDPVFQSQSVFRALMDAMARPGTIAPRRRVRDAARTARSRRRRDRADPLRRTTRPSG